HPSPIGARGNDAASTSRCLSRGARTMTAKNLMPVQPKREWSERMVAASATIRYALRKVIRSPRALIAWRDLRGGCPDVRRLRYARHHAASVYANPDMEVFCDPVPAGRGQDVGQGVIVRTYRGQSRR